DFTFSIALEDIHTHIERALIERLGDVGRKLHTGSSRNDQVVTDATLWARAAHYFLAYGEKYQRDRERLADCRKRVNVLPLGAAALAGTSLPIDRDSVRRQLGFDALAG